MLIIIVLFILIIVDNLYDFVSSNIRLFYQIMCLLDLKLRVWSFLLSRMKHYS